MSTPDNYEDKLEKWLEMIHMDPLTSLLDYLQFQVDVYDSKEEILIEALLPDELPEHISVFIEDNAVTIRSGNIQSKERLITLPFRVNSQKVSANYCQSILEISISKLNMIRTPRNRYIRVFIK